MPLDIAKDNPPLGAVIYQWTVQEFEPHSRGRRWYIIMGALAVFLILFAFFTANYLFALVVVLFGIILYLHDVQPPLEVPFAITETGIVLGRKFYRYSELNNFWMIYQPPAVKNLYFSLNNILRHRLQIPLRDFDPRPIKEALSRYVVEETGEEEEPLSDRLARIFKLH